MKVGGYFFYLHLVPTGEDWATYICIGGGGVTDCEWLIATGDGDEG